MKDKILSDIFANIISIVLTVALRVLLIKVGWSLFMVPVLAFPAIGLLEALGLSLLSAVLRPSGVSK